MCCIFFFAGSSSPHISFFFFFNDTATTEIYTLSLHDALPISTALRPHARDSPAAGDAVAPHADPLLLNHIAMALDQQLAAVGAPRMLPASDPARKIARIHEIGRAHV